MICGHSHNSEIVEAKINDGDRETVPHFYIKIQDTVH